MIRDAEERELIRACEDLGLPAPQIRRPGLEDILLAMLREYRRGEVGNAVPETDPVK